MKGAIVDYKTFDQISQVAINFLARELGLENIEYIGYGKGPYARAPLIIKTKDGKTYKLTPKTFSVLLNGKWKILKHNPL